MPDLIRVGKRLVPIEHVALIEPYVHLPEAPIRTSREFKSRIVLLNRDSFLSEEAPERIAEEHAFRLLTADCVATSPVNHFSVEEFQPTEHFKPAKNYRTRLSWFDLDGNSQSKLLVTEPELVLAVAIRGTDINQPAAVVDDEPAKRPRQKRGRSTSAALKRT